MIKNKNTSSIALAAMLALDPAPPMDSYTSFHGQATIVSQANTPLRSSSEGKNSLHAQSELATSFTSTLFMGMRLGEQTEFFVNPEISAGAGLSGTHGIAGYPNGEIYRVDAPGLRPNLSRFYLRHDFALDDFKEEVQNSINQIAGKRPRTRITAILGKFSLNDFFDTNRYSHDPRTQFLNWSLMDNGAWDYSADTRGYTWGGMLEYTQSFLTTRLAFTMVPTTANGSEFDTQILKANSTNLEFEFRYFINQKPGAFRILGYLNQALMRSYQEKISALKRGIPLAPNTGEYGIKYGFGINLEQEITPDLGFFTRVGFNDGAYESWMFTEIDHTVSFGLALTGSNWKRPEDVIGAAFITNGISALHQEFLSNGGYGFIIGDGYLNYGPETLLEIYYRLSFLGHLSLTADYQFANNPAYNKSRGPVNIFALRLHGEF